MKINKGQVLERAVRRSALNISELAKTLKVNRKSVYNWFKQEDLKEEVFFKVGDIINFSFQEKFPELFQQQPDALHEAAAGQQDDTYWKDKYIDLLERYADLLSEKD